MKPEPLALWSILLYPYAEVTENIRSRGEWAACSSPSLQYVYMDRAEGEGV